MRDCHCHKMSAEAQGQERVFQHTPSPTFSDQRLEQPECSAASAKPYIASDLVANAVNKLETLNCRLSPSTKIMFNDAADANSIDSASPIAKGATHWRNPINLSRNSSSLWQDLFIEPFHQPCQCEASTSTIKCFFVCCISSDISVEITSTAAKSSHTRHFRSRAPPGQETAVSVSAQLGSR